MWRSFIGIIAVLSLTLVGDHAAFGATASTTIIYCDVDADEYYSPAIIWAHETDIARGLDGDFFGPDQPISRGQFVTVLYRYANWADGQTPTVSAANPFVDVSEGAYYETAVRWAVDNDITVGVDATHFDPNGPSTRAQTATFLYRYKHSPPISYNDTFGDVSSSAWFAPAVSWLVSEGITTGTAPGRFSPSRLTTRAQVVTFLWRLAGSPAPQQLPETRQCPTTFTVIGDSVMLGVVLRDDLTPSSFANWSGTIETAVCRQAVIDTTACSLGVVPSVLTTIRRAAASGTLGEVVIIHTGTNGPFNDQSFDLIVEAAAGADSIWFMNVQNRRSWESEINARIEAGVARWAPYRKIGLLDWFSITQANPGLVVPSDGTHVSSTGSDAYAALVATALRP